MEKIETAVADPGYFIKADVCQYCPACIPCIICANALGVDLALVATLG